MNTCNSKHNLSLQNRKKAKKKLRNILLILLKIPVSAKATRIYYMNTSEHNLKYTPLQKESGNIIITLLSTM